MSARIKIAGAWGEIKNILVKQGAWQPVKQAYMKQGGAWVEIYSATRVYNVPATTTNMNVSTLFSPEDWAAPHLTKVVNIPVGVIVGATSTGNYALRTGTGRGGPLIINVLGEIQGAGGQPNGGAGGHAVYVEQSNVTINVTGAIRAGGGAGGYGGTGGTGGQGYYTTSYTVREPSSGDYKSNSYHMKQAGFYPAQTYWAGSKISSGFGTQTYGSVTYYQGGYWQSLHEGGEAGYAANYYGIYRTYPSSYNTYTSGGSGGAGGSGGRGQGYNQSALGGSGGAAGAYGGTNAGQGGTGGTGGSGGGWGGAGATGNTGNQGGWGNWSGWGSAGSAGSSGGAAGQAILGVARTLNNNGTINGAVV